ncbi:hypothetical protein KFL_005110030 [Klebsormidium nitens]|uniref:MYND-type domain-containing protein n=1 Tax=Klebsormidium nitens TaxID=105231 RepID=A0A1Y1IJN0_KLENI|nr:hypothetical protein KFL_005110030 [Klebsormidium nitens]|eukprot:GAQ89321.1 hypothetical protein KFL_005110030 [Klebsormidium nitens]
MQGNRKLTVPQDSFRLPVSVRKTASRFLDIAAEAIASLFEKGVVRKLLSVLAHMAARASDVPCDARLINFCKMLEVLANVLANLSNRFDLFGEEMRAGPDFAISMVWVITHWDYELSASIAALSMVDRMLISDRIEDRAAASDIVRQEGVLAAATDYVINTLDSNVRLGFDARRVEAYNLSFLSVEDLPPGALSPAVVSTLVRVAAGTTIQADARMKAAELLRRFLGQGLVSPDQTGVQLPCDECWAAKFSGELKRCSRCKGARYCSPECQRAGWKEHKKSCVAMPTST